MRTITILFFIVIFVTSCTGGNILIEKDKKVQVNPFYGWGWSDAKSKKIIDLPEPFIIKLESLLKCKGEYKGGIGNIITKSHSLSNKWVLFTKRYVAPADLRKKGYDYNISIFSVQPNLKIDFCENKVFEGSEVFGYGELYYK